MAPRECQSDRVPWDDTFCSWSSLHVCSSEKLSVLFITLFGYRTCSLVPSFLTSGPEFWEHLKVFCHSICKYSKKCSSNYFRTFEMFCNSIWNVPNKVSRITSENIWKFSKKVPGIVFENIWKSSIIRFQMFQKKVSRITSEEHLKKFCKSIWNCSKKEVPEITSENILKSVVSPFENVP